MKLHQLLSLQILLSMFLCEINGISYDPTSATFNDINVVLTSSQFNNPSECPKILLSVKVSFNFIIMIYINYNFILKNILILIFLKFYWDAIFKLGLG